MFNLGRLNRISIPALLVVERGECQKFCRCCVFEFMIMHYGNEDTNDVHLIQEQTSTNKPRLTLL